MLIALARVINDTTHVGISLEKLREIIAKLSNPLNVALGRRESVLL